MKYNDLNIAGKIWYFILLIPVILLIIFVTILIASFTILLKIAKASKLLDATSAWTKVISDGFNKKVKNAGIRKSN